MMKRCFLFKTQIAQTITELYTQNKYKGCFCIFAFLLLGLFITSCNDEDSFSTSRNNILTLPTDTVKLDTLFSNTASSTYGFWVHNNNSNGIRINSIRLERGNQTGFRINADGVYLDNANGSIAHDFEIRKNDSLRIFIELTSHTTGRLEPQEITDNLVFAMESGIEQKINIKAWSWDADMVDSLIINSNTTLSPIRPYVVRKGIKVEENATLNILAGTKMFFHDKAGIDVYGTLNIEGASDNEVVLRGDRLDRMFDYLPYDRVSGQWRGIHFFETSTDNRISFADIHSTKDAIVCDSTEYDDTEIRLKIDNSSIHNCDGYGLIAYNSNIEITNTCISNTLGNCLAIYGGKCNVVYTTLAQFYPFSGARGSALFFTNIRDGYPYPLNMLSLTNTIVTGYATDELQGKHDDSQEGLTVKYSFTNCILRTPAIKEEDEEYEHFTNVIFESTEDSIYGKLHFVNIDEDNLYYDFRLAENSPAHNKALPIPYITYDRRGIIRSQETPSIGAYE